MSENKISKCLDCNYRHTHLSPCPNRVMGAVLWCEHDHVTSADWEFIQKNNLDEHNVPLSNVFEWWIAKMLGLEGSGRDMS